MKQIVGRRMNLDLIEADALDYFVSKLNNYLNNVEN